MVESLASNAAISEEIVAALNVTHDPVEVKNMLTSALSINSREDHTKEQREVAVDFFFYCFAFTKEAGFTPLKASTYLSIVKRVMDYDQAMPLAGPTGDALKSSFEAFKGLVLAHSVERPPHSTGVFDAGDVSSIVEYMLNAYYRHIKLYCYIFTRRVHTSLIQCAPHGVEAFQLPARPLDEALPQAVTVAKVGQSAAPPDPPKEDGVQGMDDDSGASQDERGETA